MDIFKFTLGSHKKLNVDRTGNYKKKIRNKNKKLVSNGFFLLIGHTHGHHKLCGILK
jgi:hypothetical protein